MKDSGNGKLDEGGQVGIEERVKEYILHRFKTMSYFSSCVPYEYPSHMIVADILKAEIGASINESDIDEVIREAKQISRKKILGMLRQRRPVSEIRDWCELSLWCPVPIQPINAVGMNQLLSRYDYFNYEVNRIVREEQIELAMNERRTRGALFDPARLTRDFESMVTSDSSDEFTRIEQMSSEEIDEVVRETEKNSRSILMAYLVEDADPSTVYEKASGNPEVVFARDELMQVIDELIRSERFAIITREVARMGASEMWNLINNIETYKLWQMSLQSEGKRDSPTSGNQMLEMLKMYAHSRDSLTEGYLFQVSRLNSADLAQLVRLIQGYISWRSAFHYLPPGSLPSTEGKLSSQIIEGFAMEHGMDPEIFRKFLIKNQ